MFRQHKHILEKLKKKKYTTHDVDPIIIKRKITTINYKPL